MPDCRYCVLQNLNMNPPIFCCDNGINVYLYDKRYINIVQLLNYEKSRGTNIMPKILYNKYIVISKIALPFLVILPLKLKSVGMWVWLLFMYFIIKNDNENVLYIWFTESRSLLLMKKGGPSFSVLIFHKKGRIADYHTN